MTNVTKVSKTAFQRDPTTAATFIDPTDTSEFNSSIAAADILDKTLDTDILDISTIIEEVTKNDLEIKDVIRKSGLNIVQILRIVNKELSGTTINQALSIAKLSDLFLLSNLIKDRIKEVTAYSDVDNLYAPAVNMLSVLARDSNVSKISIIKGDIIIDQAILLALTELRIKDYKKRNYLDKNSLMLLDSNPIKGLMESELVPSITSSMQGKKDIDQVDTVVKYLVSVLGSKLTKKLIDCGLKGIDFNLLIQMFSDSAFVSGMETLGLNHTSGYDIQQTLLVATDDVVVGVLKLVDILGIEKVIGLNNAILSTRIGDTTQSPNILNYVSETLDYIGLSNTIRIYSDISKISMVKLESIDIYSNLLTDTELAPLYKHTQDIGGVLIKNLIGVRLNNFSPVNFNTVCTILNNVAVEKRAQVISLFFSSYTTGLEDILSLTENNNITDIINIHGRLSLLSEDSRNALSRLNPENYKVIADLIAMLSAKSIQNHQTTEEIYTSAINHYTTLANIFYSLDQTINDSMVLLYIKNGEVSDYLHSLITTKEIVKYNKKLLDGLLVDLNTTLTTNATGLPIIDLLYKLYSDVDRIMNRFTDNGIIPSTVILANFNDSRTSLTTLKNSPNDITINQNTLNTVIVDIANIGSVIDSDIVLLSDNINSVESIFFTIKESIDGMAVESIAYNSLSTILTLRQAEISTTKTELSTLNFTYVDAGLETDKLSNLFIQTIADISSEKIKPNNYITLKYKDSSVIENSIVSIESMLIDITKGNSIRGMVTEINNLILLLPLTLDADSYTGIISGLNKLVVDLGLLNKTDNELTTDLLYQQQKLTTVFQELTQDNIFLYKGNKLDLIKMETIIKELTDLSNLTTFNVNVYFDILANNIKIISGLEGVNRLVPFILNDLKSLESDISDSNSVSPDNAALLLEIIEALDVVYIVLFGRTNHYDNLNKVMSVFVSDTTNRKYPFKRKELNTIYVNDKLINLKDELTIFKNNSIIVNSTLNGWVTRLTSVSDDIQSILTDITTVPGYSVLDAIGAINLSIMNYDGIIDGYDYIDSGLVATVNQLYIDLQLISSTVNVTNLTEIDTNLTLVKSGIVLEIGKINSLLIIVTPTAVLYDDTLTDLTSTIDELSNNSIGVKTTSVYLDVHSNNIEDEIARLKVSDIDEIYYLDLLSSNIHIKGLYILLIGIHESIDVLLTRAKVSVDNVAGLDLETLHELGDLYTVLSSNASTNSDVIDIIKSKENEILFKLFNYSKLLGDSNLEEYYSLISKMDEDDLLQPILAFNNVSTNMVTILLDMGMDYGLPEVLNTTWSNYSYNYPYNYRYKLINGLMKKFNLPDGLSPNEIRILGDNYYRLLGNILRYWCDDIDQPNCKYDHSPWLNASTDTISTLIDVFNLVVPALIQRDRKYNL